MNRNLDRERAYCMDDVRATIEAYKHWRIIKRRKKLKEMLEIIFIVVLVLLSFLIPFILYLFNF